MLHAVRPAQLRRPRDGAAGIRAAPEGRRFKEAAAAHPAATRQGTVVGWPPRRCGKMAGQAFLCILSFILNTCIMAEELEAEIQLGSPFPIDNIDAEIPDFEDEDGDQHAVEAHCNIQNFPD